MGNYDRGVYEPPSDERRVFDGGETMDDEDEEGSRVPLLIVIALIVVAAFLGVVWLAYTQGVAKGRETAPRVITAENGPMKTAPADAGGTQTPYTGLKIYEQPAPDDEDIGKSDVTPPPTQTKPATTAKTQTPPPAAKTQAPPAKTPAPTTVAKASPPPATVKAPPVSASGGWVLQVGAYKSEAEANAAWATYQKKHPIVGGYSPDIQKADLGAKGTWYRLRISGFSDKTAASTLCDKLKADGGGCFPAKR